MRQDIDSASSKLIVGLGLTGLSCARYFASRHEGFSVTDSRQQPPGLEAFRQEFPDVPLELGHFNEGSFMQAGELVISPGVDLRHPLIRKARAAGVSITGDINIFAHATQKKIAAVTGSNAKSTVVSLLGEMAKAAGVNVGVGGNIGTPVLDLLRSADTEQNSPDLYVLELSSFQLETTEALGAEVATVLNISPDHMDRYDSMTAYHAAKHRIFQACKQAVINKDEALSAPLLPAGVKQWRFGLDAGDINEFGVINKEGENWLAFNRKALLPASNLKLAGQHNVSNALAALAMGHALGLEFTPMLQALQSFPGLPHRCQWVAMKKGVSYYNDSKGTNVGACKAALKGLGKNISLILIAGGQGKGADFSELQDAVKQSCKLVLVYGEDAGAIADALSDVIQVIKTGSLEEAVVIASGHAQAGDAVLLSPACASFDMFKNYEHRGQAFIAAVEALH